MNSTNKIQKIIDYAKTLGIVEITEAKQILDKDSFYYGLPELPTVSWFFRVYDGGTNLDFVNVVSLFEPDLQIVTHQARNYKKIIGYKFHLKSLVRDAKNLIIKQKKHKEQKKMERLEDEIK